MKISVTVPSSFVKDITHTYVAVQILDLMQIRKLGNILTFLSFIFFSIGTSASSFVKGKLHYTYVCMYGCMYVWMYVCM
jgi:hypothetical protein